MTEPTGATTASATVSTAMPPRLAFVLPPPVTFFVQFQDGMQVAITQTPTPLVVGLPSDGNSNSSNIAMMMPGLLSQLFGGSSNNGTTGEDDMMRVLHDLFVQAQQQQHGPPPSSRAFLDKLPVKIWSDKLKGVERQDECPICLGDFETDDQVITLPCNHLFHKECGLRWLVEHNVCPTCRYQLPTQQDEAAAPSATTAPSTTTAPPPVATAANPAPQPRLSRTRPRSPAMAPIRVVRRRVEEVQEPFAEPEPAAEPEPETTLDNAALELLLEQEADRLVAEERQAEAATAMDLDTRMEQDAESLLQSNMKMKLTK